MKTAGLTMILLLLVLVPHTLVAQSPDDPEIIKAKEETAVVFDLVRFFGFLGTMEEEQPTLALSRDQLDEVYDIMNKIRATERLEAEMAKEILVQLEDEVLSPDQLMEVDQLFIAREAERTVSTGQGGGEGGLITSYIAGGPFNPSLDASKTMGKDFAAFYKSVAERVGK